MGIALTVQAQRLLARRPRETATEPLTRTAVEALLAQEGCPLDHPIVELQLALGGHSYVAHGHHPELVRLGMGPAPLIYEERGTWYCECLEYARAQWYVLMDQRGVIYYDNGPNIDLKTMQPGDPDKDLPTPCAASLQTLVESDAMYDALLEEAPVWYAWATTIQTAEREWILRSVEVSPLVPIAAASDPVYHRWDRTVGMALHAYRLPDWPTDTVIWGYGHTPDLRDDLQAWVLGPGRERGVWSALSYYVYTEQGVKATEREAQA